MSDDGQTSRQRASEKARQERRAAALRANLLRRKAQARARVEPDTPGTSTVRPGGGFPLSDNEDTPG